MQKKLISIVFPVFNEAGNIESLLQRVEQHVPKQYGYEYLFIDDGSSDETLALIKKLGKTDRRVKYLSFTRNFGHQHALRAGLDTAVGAAVISMDGDGQHPAELLPKMIREWERGAKIVYTRRANDPNLSAMKNLTSNFFYRLINLMSETKIEVGAADFRLLDREVVETLKALPESTLFLRGLVTWSGYSAKALDYRPGRRSWGKSKYTYPRMLQLAVDAITSFSIVPLRLATVIGFFMAMATGLYGLYAIIAWFTDWQVITGWPSVIISVLFIGGLQLMILGIIGEYIGKIFMETKKRPLYIVKEQKL